RVPKEVWDDVLEYMSQVKFIQNLTSIDRPYISDCEVMTYINKEGKEVTYDDGRRKIDLTNPHILEDLDFFRERAIFFEKNGRYTNLIPNPNPKSEYAAFWAQELHRWKYGLVRPDGEWIPGELYFYWNYSPIWLTEKKDKKSSAGSKKERGERVRKF